MNISERGSWDPAYFPRIYGSGAWGGVNKVGIHTLPKREHKYFCLFESVASLCMSLSMRLSFFIHVLEQAVKHAIINTSFERMQI